YGARVVQRPWRGFAAARNHAMSLSFARYCMWLDGDDEISAADVERIRVALMPAPPNMGFFISLYCESPFPERRLTCDQLRIYPNLPGVVWDRKIHEQVINSCARIGCRFAKIPATVRHLGYDLSEEANRAKYERNMALLQEE